LPGWPKSDAYFALLGEGTRPIVMRLLGYPVSSFLRRTHIPPPVFRSRNHSYCSLLEKFSGWRCFGTHQLWFCCRRQQLPTELRALRPRCLFRLRFGFAASVNELKGERHE
jgi:hypothetical protein